ncbi:hypothetical protein [Vreelandella populi]|uniref:Methyltransferase domain-containing protein n=1 Tax=Vreelandella populi TaxID=2498858 RepID=A0A3S0WHY6_9GAMM|nr:hypothetical protein [Halomonas populi]RUR40112.1 hypothetical protein ELY25_04730 [Halomonas populi]RUR43984.1 hypothetical protein ELY37_16375 [Halomonas populi]
MPINYLNEHEKLTALYQKTSKHSNYQTLPDCLKNLISEQSITTKSRFEKERFDYIQRVLHFKDKKIMDIGGNTGYFTFQSIAEGAKNANYVEGNKTHAEFVQAASRALKWNEKISITSEYYNFENSVADGEHFNIVLLLNVLHHLGDDYGVENSIPVVKSKIIEQLNSIANITHFCVFQLGFNWKGDREMGLFENGQKREMIDYLVKGTQNNWDIINIGIPEIIDNKIVYCDANNQNLDRNNSLGEFLNRPLFILEAKKSSAIS